MSESIVIVNKPAQSVADIIRAVEYNLALPIIEMTAISVFPFLGYPFIKQIFHAVLVFMAGKVYEPLARIGINFSISFQTDAQKAAKMVAEGKLRVANMSGDPKKIKEATDEFKSTVFALMHYDGSAKP